MSNEANRTNGAAGLAKTIDAAQASIGALTRQLEVGSASAAPAGAADVLREVQQLLARINADLAPSPAAAAETARTLFFDVSDLLGYFPHNRLPTGIQRVQINTILHLLDDSGDWRIVLCRFVESRDQWLEVPLALFRAVTALSMAEGDPTAANWLSEVARLEGAILAGAPLRFPEGACLVNLGTSWWLPNYFMYIRQAKIASGIRYVPLIHDLIPAIMPDYCHPDLVHEFIDWLVSVLQHADFFLAVSDSTKADLIRLAGQLGRDISPDLVAAVPLAAELNDPATEQQARRVPLSRWNLAAGNFVLFVSTIEARKNQVGAFEAWQKLISAHGKDKVPQLVCVGKKGFHHERATARLDMSPDLRDRVTLLSNVNDAELEALYRNCQFTIYPTLYEGWGLPVTESLRYGKVPVTSSSSSLPQAGGGFSVQFETGSTGAFVAVLEKMIFDQGFREGKEAAIASNFVARSWRDVARDVERQVSALAERSDETVSKWRTPAADPGYYPMTRNREMQVLEGMSSAEIFRHGGGWWRLEDFGCWTKPSGGELLMRLRPGPARIGLELAGLPTTRTIYTVATADGTVALTGSIARQQRSWVFLDIPAALTEGDLLIRVSGLQTEIVVDTATELRRNIGVGLSSFYVFDTSNPHARMDFVEAVALGGLGDHRVGIRCTPV